MSDPKDGTLLSSFVLFALLLYIPVNRYGHWGGGGGGGGVVHLTTFFPRKA